MLVFGGVGLRNRSHAFLTVAGLVGLLPTAAFLWDNVVSFFFPQIVADHPHWFVANVFVTGTLKTFIAGALWFMCAGITLYAMQRAGWGLGGSQPQERTRAWLRHRLLIWIVGALSTYCLLATFGTFQRNLAPLFQQLGIDTFFSQPGYADNLQEPDYTGYDPLLAFFTPIVVAGAEEIVNVGLLALLARRYQRGWGFILIASALIRAMLHLHRGSLSIVLAMLPLAVFTVAFYRKTAMISPLVIGHMAWNFSLLATESIDTSLATRIGFSAITYLLPIATICLLVIAILRACNWQHSNRQQKELQESD
ncbi:CPBP family intramembrane glutamic endopeptidase [Trueperella pyogenes]|uniref:CPBP family intramembrane glutamic endopeptidase n=1 Tax=Trueperella pyogenes TaxID=1661 RepID=UPI00345D8D5E